MSCCPDQFMTVCHELDAEQCMKGPAPEVVGLHLSVEGGAAVGILVPAEPPVVLTSPGRGYRLCPVPEDGGDNLIRMRSIAQPWTQLGSRPAPEEADAVSGHLVQQPSAAARTPPTDPNRPL